VVSSFTKLDGVELVQQSTFFVQWWRHWSVEVTWLTL